MSKILENNKKIDRLLTQSEMNIQEQQVERSKLSQMNQFKEIQ